jgi:hypothetical protein
VRAALARCFAFLALALFAALPLQARVVYKWTDMDGKVQYSDQPPKNFKGSVTRIEADVPADNPAVPPPAGPKRAIAPAAAGEPARDIARERRDRRERLSARLDQARAKVDEARKALSDGEEAQDGERQVIQQRVLNKGNTGAQQMAPNPDPTQNQPATGGGMGMVARSNCRAAKDANGKVVQICAAAILNDAYFERQARLEEALHKAEEELSAAEEAYRRGVD